MSIRMDIGLLSSWGPQQHFGHPEHFLLHLDNLASVHKADPQVFLLSAAPSRQLFPTGQRQTHSRAAGEEADR